MRFFKAFLPTVLMFVIALAAVVGSLGFAYYSSRKAEEELSYHLVSASFKRIQNVVDVLLLDNAWWDDAFVNLTVNYDHDWFFRNLASSDLLDNTIHGLAFIKNDGKLQSQYVRDNNDIYKISAQSFGQNYAFILQKSLERSVDTIEPFSFIAQISGTPTLFSICAVAARRKEIIGDFPREKSDFMIFWKLLQKEDLERMETDLHLANLAFTSEVASARYVLNDVHNRAVVGLIWEEKAGKLNPLAYPLAISVIMFGSLLLGGRSSFRKISQLVAELNEARLQAQSSNRIKSEFLATMSHELRTPLNSIIGFSEVLTSEGNRKLDEKQAEYVGYIHSSGKHLLTIINEVLDMSKIEAGKFELQNGEIDLHPVIQDCLRLTQPAMKEKNIQIIETLPDDIPDMLGDAKLIKQVLLNILSNAIKFTGPGGQITIVLRLTDAGELKLSVEDTGIGIAPDRIEMVLLPYAQDADHRTRSEQGTGLGLSISKGFMELHDGKLDITSVPDKGTIVTLTFPASRVL